MKIYVYKSDGRFFTISENPIAREDIMEVPTLPPNGFHWWDASISQWTELTEAEINAGASYQTSTTKNAFVLFEDAVGDSFKDSGIFVDEIHQIVNYPYSLNLTSEKDFYLNGRSITKKDRQIAIANSEENYNLAEWAIVPNLSLTSKNAYPAKYEIAIELLAWVSRNKSPVEFGLFINDEPQPQDTINIPFDLNNEPKPLSLSNDYELPPNTQVSVRWRSGDVVKLRNICYCSRRKLLIQELDSY